MLVILALLVFLYFGHANVNRTEISYDFFWKQLQTGNVAEVEFRSISFWAVSTSVPKRLPNPSRPRIGPNDCWAKVPRSETKAPRLRKNRMPPNPRPHLLPFNFAVTLPPVEDRELLPLLREKKVEIGAQPPADNTLMLLVVYLFVPLLLFAGLWVMLRRTRDQFLGGGILSGFSKSPAKRYEEAGKKTITFNDVAGLENVKNDLQEIVEFLKNPEKFTRLGGRVPKGVLLMGPPGTGKTLLARAVAGEAGVPFFSISGSEFIQMFVGVGASRVRDMFKTAKEASPCILFIDEIDAVGRHRGAGLGGGHDEREQTLNQILSEMDGFSQTESVIVLAATNRPDVLDPALLRPGRFDRHITVDRPNQKARLAIFKVHTRDVPLAADVNLERLAAGTVGLTGADIRNLVNEAALWATRNGKDKVDMEDFEYARDKVLMGPKREELLTGKEKKMTRLSRGGSRAAGVDSAGRRSLHKVTIIPRGRALGVTQLLPEEDRLQHRPERIRTAGSCFMLGGRAAEKLIFNEFSAGAESDLVAGHQAGPKNGGPLGHERTHRPGGLPHRRGTSLPGPRNLRTARIQRAQRPGDRRRSVAHLARSRCKSDGIAVPTAAKTRRAWPRALEQREMLDETGSRRNSSAPRAIPAPVTTASRPTPRWTKRSREMDNLVQANLLPPQTTNLDASTSLCGFRDLLLS